MIDKVKHKILKSDIQLKINGFNDFRVYKTNIVEIPIMVGLKEETIIAAVVPEIRPKICRVGLDSIVTKFKENNMVLADQYLDKGNSNNIDILLGVNSADILPIHAVSFGVKGNKSLLYYSRAGILLCGQISLLQKNVEHLAYVKDLTDKFDSFFQSATLDTSSLNKSR